MVATIEHLQVLPKKMPSLPTVCANIHGRRGLGYQGQPACAGSTYVPPLQLTSMHMSLSYPIERFSFLRGCIRGTQESSVEARDVLTPVRPKLQTGSN